MDARDEPYTVLLTSREVERLPDGIRRRVDHLRDSASASGPVEVRPLDRGVGSRARRATHLLREVARLVRQRRRVRVIVVGLLSPKLLSFSGALAMLGIDVIFDACDSWLLLESSVPTGSHLAQVARQGAKLQSSRSSRFAVSYISSRDASADATLNASSGRRVDIIPPTAPTTLRELPPPRADELVQRFVFSGDPESFHVRLGVDLLRAAWPQHHRRFPESRLDVYGERADRLAAGKGSVSHGFAIDIRDLYAGPTAVIVANQLASGVPNKLVEAVAANRPIVLHASLGDLVAPHPWLQLFHDEATLVRALAYAQELQLVPCSPIAWSSGERSFAKGIP